MDHPITTDPRHHLAVVTAVVSREPVSVITHFKLRASVGIAANPSITSVVTGRIAASTRVRESIVAHLVALDLTIPTPTRDHHTIARTIIPIIGVTIVTGFTRFRLNRPVTTLTNYGAAICPAIIPILRVAVVAGLSTIHHAVSAGSSQAICATPIDCDVRILFAFIANLTPGRIHQAITTPDTRAISVTRGALSSVITCLAAVNHTIPAGRHLARSTAGVHFGVRIKRTIVADLSRERIQLPVPTCRRRAINVTQRALPAVITTLIPIHHQVPATGRQAGIPTRIPRGVRVSVTVVAKLTCRGV